MARGFEKCVLWVMVGIVSLSLSVLPWCALKYNVNHRDLRPQKSCGLLGTGYFWYYHCRFAVVCTEESWCFTSTETEWLIKDGILKFLNPVFKAELNRSRKQDTKRRNCAGVFLSGLYLAVLSASLYNRSIFLPRLWALQDSEQTG